MNVNENNVRPNLSDILEGNHNIRLTVQESKQFIAARDHDFADTAAAGVKFQIAYPSQLSAVLYVDDILAFQFGKKHSFASLTYALTIRSMPYPLR